MTIMGVAAGRDRAAVWADTLITGRQGDTSHSSKLAINAMCGVVGTGTGRVSILVDAERAVLASDSLATIVPAVAHALRTAAMRLVSRRQSAELEPGWFGRNLFVVAGWDEAEGRMTAYEFSAQDLFEPRVKDLSLSPWVDVAWCACPSDLSRIRTVAAEQASVLRAHDAQAGRLTIATITQHGLVALPPSEIAAEPTTAPPSAAHSAETDAEAPAVPPLAGEPQSRASESTCSIKLVA